MFKKKFTSSREDTKQFLFYFIFLLLLLLL